MAQQGRAHPEVRLRVLKVDGVHFVRHGRAPDLALGRRAPEDPEADVVPHVGCEVLKNRVQPDNQVCTLGDPVVGLDLCRNWVMCQPEPADKLSRHVEPGRLWICSDMSAEGPGRSIDFAEVLEPVGLFELAGEPRHDDGEFLADRCRRRCLTVGPGNCRRRCLSASEPGDLGREFAAVTSLSIRSSTSRRILPAGRLYAAALREIHLVEIALYNPLLIRNRSDLSQEVSVSIHYRKLIDELFVSTFNLAHTSWGISRILRGGLVG